MIRSVQGVKDVCVVGVEDPELGTQNVRAVLVPADETDKTLLQDSVKAKCLEQLPRYSVPKEIICVPELPLNGVGKIDRIKLGSDYAKQIAY